MPVEGDDLEPAAAVSRHGPGSSRPSCLGQDEVLGRVEVEGQRSVELDDGRAGGLGRGQVRGAAADAERERDRVGWADEQHVRAASVAVGDDRDERPVPDACRPPPAPTTEPIVSGEIPGRSAARTTIALAPSAAARPARDEQPSFRPASALADRRGPGRAGGAAGPSGPGSRRRPIRSRRPRRRPGSSAEQAEDERLALLRVERRRPAATSPPRDRGRARSRRAATDRRRQVGAWSTSYPVGAGSDGARARRTASRVSVPAPDRSANASISRGQPGAGRVVGHDRVGDERSGGRAPRSPARGRRRPCRGRRRRRAPA